MYTYILSCISRFLQRTQQSFDGQHGIARYRIGMLFALSQSFCFLASHGRIGELAECDNDYWDRHTWYIDTLAHTHRPRKESA